MQIQVNSDSTVDSSKVIDVVETEVETALGRHADRITRVEVHFQDVNARKGGEDDIRCLMEVRIAGLQPLAVEARAGTMGAAISVAVDRLQRLVDGTLGKRDDARRGPAAPAPEEPSSDSLSGQRH